MFLVVVDDGGPTTAEWLKWIRGEDTEREEGQATSSPRPEEMGVQLRG